MGLVCWIGLLASVCSANLDQLYTGVPATIPAGRFQYQFAYDTDFGRQSRIGYTSLTGGLSSNFEVRAAYGHLWNLTGPDLRLGPTLGAKWRFAGDGWLRPSAAISTLYAFRDDVGGRPRGDDVGAALLISAPVDGTVVLGNLGRVWVGEDASDLVYLAFALARPIASRLLAAVQYNDFDRIGGRGVDPSAQVALGLVWRPREKWTYSLQPAYLLEGRRAKWHTTVGVSVMF